MEKWLDDVLILVGCALILVGVYAVCPVAVWFVAGGMCVAMGIAIGIGARAAGQAQERKE